MNCTTRPRPASAMTLVEMLTAASIGLLILTGVVFIYVFGLSTFGALGNYADMDSKSRQAMDLIMREIREANMVSDVQTNGTAQWLALSNTLAVPPVSDKFTWDANTRTLVWDKTGQSTMTLLTGCDSWSVALYLRVPTTNGFTTATNLWQCKRINLSWSCSRTNVIRKMNTESMVTADVVLRNLQE